MLFSYNSPASLTSLGLHIFFGAEKITVFIRQVFVVVLCTNWFTGQRTAMIMANSCYRMNQGNDGLALLFFKSGKFKFWCMVAVIWMTDCLLATMQRTNILKMYITNIFQSYRSVKHNSNCVLLCSLLIYLCNSYLFTSECK